MAMIETLLAGRQRSAGGEGGHRSRSELTYVQAPESSAARPAEPIPTAPKPTARPRPSLHLLGPLRLLDAHGRDRTPRSALLQALLAFLALSPHGKRTRTKLRDLFWDDANSEHAGQNLRQTLFRLRQTLAASGLDIVEMDPISVRLRLDVLDVDLLRFFDGGDGPRGLLADFGPELPDILEGINLGSADREEFEDWLRQERQRWWERLDELRRAAVPAQAINVTQRPAARAAPPPVGLPEAPAQGFAVGLLPSAVGAASPGFVFLADAFVESVATALRDVALAEIHDYRDGGQVFPPIEGSGPQVLLRVKIHEEGPRVMLTLVAFQSSRNRLLWKWSVEVPQDDASGLAVMRFVNEGVDRICQTLATLDTTGVGGNAPFHALNVMFRLDNESLASARRILETAFEATGDAVHLSLLAYLNSFRVGEHWLTYDDSVRDETQKLVDAIIETQPFNSLTLAMTGHACGYILHDHCLAIDLLERSTHLDASLAICWDHLALNYLYAGRLADAERASAMAVHLGGFSPFRFTYDATMCMICTIKGDYARAVEFGERSLARRSNFGAPLRYTAVSYAHLGQTDAARRIVGRIRSMSPDFSADWVSANRLAVADQEAKSRLLIGLKRAGA